MPGYWGKEEERQGRRDKERGKARSGGGGRSMAYKGRAKTPDSPDDLCPLPRLVTDDAGFLSPPAGIRKTKRSERARRLGPGRAREGRACGVTSIGPSVTLAVRVACLLAPLSHGSTTLGVPREWKKSQTQALGTGVSSGGSAPVRMRYVVVAAIVGPEILGSMTTEE